MYTCPCLLFQQDRFDDSKRFAKSNQTIFLLPKRASIPGEIVPLLYKSGIPSFSPAIVHILASMLDRDAATSLESVDLPLLARWSETFENSWQ